MASQVDCGDNNLPTHYKYIANAIYAIQYHTKLQKSSIQYHTKLQKSSKRRCVVNFTQL